MTLSWCDEETGARAWLVINSTRGGAAGGGTRMRAGCDPREVVYLAKAMELKFSLCGPPIGGAKTGIDFDPRDPRKQRVLERWYRAITPMLRERYGTGGDLNIDEVLDVVPAFERLGLQHPQEGVVRGHLQPDAETFQEIIARLDSGVQASIDALLGTQSQAMTIADMITGFGVATAVRHYFLRIGRPLTGARVLLEGFGNVGAACGLYLARGGARIVAIRDAEKTLLSPRGLTPGDVDMLIGRRTDKLLPTDDPRLGSAEAFEAAEGDVFVCAALSGTLSEARLDSLGARGVRIIACGANQPFREAKIGSTTVAQYADANFAVLPDIVANCGMARTFSYLMETNAQPVAEPIFSAVDATITDTIDAVLTRAADPDRGLLTGTLGLALDRIGVPQQ
jgi:glutamate dehydrogenase/leucine dehydrogenase